MPQRERNFFLILKSSKSHHNKSYGYENHSNCRQELKKLKNCEKIMSMLLKNIRFSLKTISTINGTFK